MNVERMAMLRDHLLNLHESRFYMGNWLSTRRERDGAAFHIEDSFNVLDLAAAVGPHGGCGTSACVAGWAAFLAVASGDLDLYERVDNVHKLRHVAEHWLGLTGDEAFHLFYGKWARGWDLGSVTAAEAAARLDQMIKEHGV